MHSLAPQHQIGEAGGEPLLAARNITVQAGRIKVLRDLSFELPRRRILGLIGESGAGKSMVGRVIAHQLPPGFAVTEGTLPFEGRDLLSLSPRAHRALLGRRIAFIPQEPMAALNPVLTVGRHFEEHLARLGVPKAQRRAAAIEVLADMRMFAPADVYDQYPFQLSGGMCQRVLIALAFVSKPALVIADEPTASLDVTTQVHIIGLLRRLQEKYGTGVIFITHQLMLAAHLCDDVAVLYAGEIVEHGPAAPLFRKPQHPYTCMLETANPRFTGATEPLLAPPGNMPGLKDFRKLSGCRFAPRCQSAIPACIAEPPALRKREDDILVRCIRERAVPAREPDQVAPPPSGMDPATPALVVVQNVVKIFRSGGLFTRRVENHAVKGVSFSVAAGEFVGIVGESGSGKTTLGRLIMGLEVPTEGRVLLDSKPLGHDAADWRRRIASIQLVFQDPRSALNPRRTVLRIVTQSMQASSYTRQGLEERAAILLKETGLPQDVAPRIPSEMSGGQRQRVNIARALCRTPRLLIADEIASGLDVSVQAQILNLLLRLRRDYNIALLMISHDLPVVRYLCSRVMVMCKGEVVESGPTQQVFSAPQHPYTRSLIEAVPPEDLSRPWLSIADRADRSIGDPLEVEEKNSVIA
jgi:dipeptide transport system ATP-binding protein